MILYRRVISAGEVELQAAAGQRNRPLPAGAVVTPLARQRAGELGLVLGETDPDRDLSGGITRIPTPAVPDEGRIRRVVTRVLLESFPSLFNPVAVRTITGMIQLRLKEDHEPVVSGK
jgi:hypothetical protein